MSTPTTKDRIIDAATDLFYMQGFHAVGLDRILDEVGVTKTTFYNHFESKDSLIEEMLLKRDRIETDELLEETRRRAKDPAERFLAIFDALHDWFMEEDFRGCIFMNAAVAFPTPHDPIHKAAARHGASIAREVREIAVGAGVADPDLLTQQAMILIGGALAARHVHDDPNGAMLARSIAEALLSQHLGRAAAG